MNPLSVSALMMLTALAAHCTVYMMSLVSPEVIVMGNAGLMPLVIRVPLIYSFSILLVEVPLLRIVMIIVRPVVPFVNWTSTSLKAVGVSACMPSDNDITHDKAAVAKIIDSTVRMSLVSLPFLEVLFLGSSELPKHNTPSNNNLCYECR